MKNLTLEQLARRHQILSNQAKIAKDFDKDLLLNRIQNITHIIHIKKNRKINSDMFKSGTFYSKKANNRLF